MTTSILQVDDLSVEFKTDDGLVRAVDRGETLGVVGESGSGKSVMNLAIMGLIPQPPGRVSRGRAMFDGKDLLKLSQRELSQIRGKRIAMIFQDPMTSLNPFLTATRRRMPPTTQSRCSAASESRAPRSGSSSTRTNSRAACGNGS
jgi:oligopeptide transport system ATP-binding protein